MNKRWAPSSTGPLSWLLVAVALGFALGAVTSLLSHKAISDAVLDAAASLLVALTGVTIACSLVWLLFSRGPFQRRRLARGDASKELAALARTWGDPAAVSKHVEALAYHAGRFYLWYQMRRLLAVVCFGLAGGFVTLIGTDLLITQNELLASQNDTLLSQNLKLDAQEVLLERQVAAAENSGKWKALWDVHYSNDYLKMRSGLVGLAEQGEDIFGVNLSASISMDLGFSSDGYPMPEVLAREVRQNALEQGLADCLQQSAVTRMFGVLDRGSLNEPNTKRGMYYESCYLLVNGAYVLQYSGVQDSAFLLSSDAFLGIVGSRIESARIKYVESMKATPRLTVDGCTGGSLVLEVSGLRFPDEQQDIARIDNSMFSLIVVKVDSDIDSIRGGSVGTGIRITGSQVDTLVLDPGDGIDSREVAEVLSSIVVESSVGEIYVGSFTENGASFDAAMTAAAHAWLEGTQEVDRRPATDVRPDSDEH